VTGTGRLHPVFSLCLAPGGALCGLAFTSLLLLSLLANTGSYRPQPPQLIEQRVRQGAQQEHRPNPKKVPPVPQSDGFLHHAESKQRKKVPPATPEDGSDEPHKVEGRKVQRSAAPPQKPASVPTLPLTAQVAAQTCESFLQLVVLFCIYAQERYATFCVYVRLHCPVARVYARIC
jgi:hypothetical protein